jgi:hypothetical protein
MSTYRVPAERVDSDTIRVEFNDDSHAARDLRALWELQESRRRAHAELYASLEEGERDGMPEPVEETFEQMFERALQLGTSSLLYGSRAPNTVMCLRDRRWVEDAREGARRTYKRGSVLNLPTVSLPIGAEVIALETSREDDPNWDVATLTFGSMNIVSPYGEDAVPLSTFRRVTQHDLLSVFCGRRTKVDVQVSANLVCKADGATFDGFRLFLHLEEQHYAIATRIEPVTCLHPKACVEEVRYVAPGSYPYSHIGARPHIVPREPERRFVCTRCWQVVVDVDDFNRKVEEMEKLQRPFYGPFVPFKEIVDRVASDFATASSEAEKGSEEPAK